MDAELDVSQVQRVIVAHQSALMSFCKEWKDAYPDKIPQAEAYLDELEHKFALPERTFLKVRRVLNGKDPEAKT